MSWEEVLDSIAANAEKAMGGEAPGDYYEDGLLVCGTCRTRKQTRIKPFGTERIVRCTCRCEVERMEKEEQERKLAMLRLRYRQEGFPESDMANWNFATDDGTDARTINAMRAYVENFADLKKHGKGLLLYGPCGTGKTFAAACAANALIDKGIPCLMTNFSRITNTVSGMFEGKQKYLDSLNNYDLVVLDDLGAERSTDYMNEMVYNIIDARYRANLPMIITSNLTGEELKNPKNIAEQRVFNRILERCHPIEVAGRDRRRQKIVTGYGEMQALLGL